MVPFDEQALILCFVAEMATRVKGNVTENEKYFRGSGARVFRATYRR